MVEVAENEADGVAGQSGGGAARLDAHRVRAGAPSHPAALRLRIKSRFAGI